MSYEKDRETACEEQANSWPALMQTPADIGFRKGADWARDYVLKQVVQCPCCGEKYSFDTFELAGIPTDTSSGGSK